ncbi:glutathione S-transferase family protein [Microbaculum sp. FT89]|uniref:glutathione S-transferase family protein n=1 Tax=Microbaculum sp. FT89 TaxID=3447298 RepID=UPI003F53059C
MAGEPGAGVTLYGAPYSVYVRIATMALLEKGVAYDQDPVDIFSAGAETEAYLALNPFGRIPALKHGDFVLYETQAITRYIDEAFDGPALQPQAPTARARMAQVIGIVDAVAYRTLVWDVYVAHTARSKGEGAEHDARISAALPLATTCLAEFDRLLDRRPCFGGDRPGLADLHAAPVFGYFRTVPEAQQLLDRFPGLQDWWATISARDSWRVASAGDTD